MPERPPTRVPPRDTGDLLRDLARDLDTLGNGLTHKVEKLADDTNARFGRGADSFTRTDEKVKGLDVRLESVEREVLVKPIPWTRVVPISLSILVLAASIVLSMERKMDRDAFELYRDKTNTRIETLEKELSVYKTTLEFTRGVLETLHRAITIQTQPHDERRK